MIKRILSLVVAIICATTTMLSWGGVVSESVAKVIADNFLSLDEEWRGETQAQARLVEEDGTPAYYIVEYNGGGWAIVSAHTSSRPVLCYNTTERYAAPAPMQEVLNRHARHVVKLARETGDEEHSEWTRIMQRKPAVDPLSVPDVAPLIKVDLNQTYPFNKYCPTINGESCLVGCVAVGMAQAMMVQRYPERAVGKYTYSDTNTGVHTIDYDAEAAYDWDAMYASPSTGDYDEIARLLYHCGVSVNMGYGVDGSGTGDKPVPTALVRNFCYDDNYIELVSRPSDDNEWLSILLDQIYLGRVIIYFGSGEQGGHCWNIDGWKQSTQMVHVNWGWGGHGNNYFDINSMKDSFQGMEFPHNNTAVVGVGTPTTAPYGIKLSKTKFVEGTAADVALADVTVSCEDETAVIEYETFGPKNVKGQHTTSPYVVRDGKLVSTKAVSNTNAFRYLKMKVTNSSTGESFEKEFSFEIVKGEDNAVDAVLSDAMRVYPSVTTSTLTVETPTAGGEYAIYNISGAQVATGEIQGYKQDVNVSSLAAGTYIVRYVHSEGVGVKTFIKR